MVQELHSTVDSLRNEIAGNNKIMFDNQGRLNEGLRASEDHIILIRRVLNDALGGVTRIEKFEVEDPETGEKVKNQKVDWGWYAIQQHYNDNQKFMDMDTLSDERIAELEKVEAQQKMVNTILYLASKAAEKDENKLRECLKGEGLDDYLKTFLQGNMVWEDDMSAMAPKVVQSALNYRDHARDQQVKLNAQKERTLIKSVISKVIASGDDAILKGEDFAAKQELISSGLPTVVKWTESMAGMLEEVIAETFKERVPLEENDPEEVEAAKQALLAETQRFGKDAAHVIELIEAGKEVEARSAMAGLEKLVKEKEEEAAKNTPHVPEGAAIFGGS